MNRQHLLVLLAASFFTFCHWGQTMAQNQAELLNEKQRCIAIIAAFTATGNLERLKPALQDGLNAGLTVNEIKEILVQMYAYAGFPRSLNGLGLFSDVLDARKAQGIEDPLGPEAHPIPTMDKNAYGAKVRAHLTGKKEDISNQKWQKFSPVIDTFLKEHLFADIFARDVLDEQSRELATIGALAAMQGTLPQLQSHLGISLNIGLTPQQLRDFASLIETRIGTQEGMNAREMLDAVLQTREQK